MVQRTYIGDPAIVEHTVQTLMAHGMSHRLASNIVNAYGQLADVDEEVMPVANVTRRIENARDNVSDVEYTNMLHDFMNRKG